MSITKTATARDLLDPKIKEEAGKFGDVLNLLT